MGKVISVLDMVKFIHELPEDIVNNATTNIDSIALAFENSSNPMLMITTKDRSK